ncbi:BREX-1 system phosphatase PglZ type A [Roseimaritima sediminicola]|uniref:BREX-1 system phosphatase PglZ type A n=1 Tax=Roseimaritima sediminicola TaxID=2662066 RepID=UPI0012983362|nr:BREX-1 system phosphatase PglZ type A [Roseimaritima sediminicola]
MSRITKALEKLFQKHRIVFWYDDESHLRDDFEAVEIDDVAKVELDNNQFGLKYRLLRQEPEQKFLLFHDGPQPEDKNNWLLDVQLAHTDFRTDKASLWLTELELPYEFKPIVAKHEHFFGLARRRDRLRASVTKTDTPSQILLKMLGICADADLRLDSVWENLLEELSEGESKRLTLIQKCGLEEFLWESVKRAYGYKSSSPSVKDFAIELFKSCYRSEVEGDSKLATESLVFLKRWKDSRTHEQAFETLSNQCAEVLAIQSDLEQRPLKQLAEVDYFRLIDLKVLSELAAAVLNKTMTAGEVTQVIRSRRRGHWFREFEHLYEAVEHAAALSGLLDTLSLQFDSLSQGIEVYKETLFRVDQVYRKFVYHSERAGNATFFQKLTETICGRYTNSFLMPLGDRWQEFIDALDRWKIPGTQPQSGFFDRYIKRVLDKNNKVFVIISDAMRYEIGEELSRRIRGEDKFDANLDAMATCLPSYTQLGMASLLPHKKLSINGDKGMTVTCDGVSSSGTAGRDKILKSAVKGDALAVQADEILGKNKEEVRTLVRDHDVIYIYHNRIDKTGHTRDTERQAFRAAEEAMDDILRLVKKLTSANASNVVITADHGFLYQDEVTESDFSQAEVTGEISGTDRRFVVGRNLKVEGAALLYSAESLGLDGDFQIAIPKSINRFRKSGSGTRFLHGGSTLQEILVPVLQVKKRRETDVSAVNVDIMPTTTSVISTGQLSVAFYQSEPVTEKVQARTLRVGIYAGDGELISDSHELVFDLSSENARERELKVRLVLSKQADEYNQQPVTLKLEEPVAGTNHFKEYKSAQFTLRRSFTSDFD